MSTGSWDELVSAALVGTDRRAYAGGALPAGASAGVAVGGGERGLLDAAAALAAFRSAGRIAPPSQRPLPAPAADDPRPELGTAACRVLRTVLGDRRFQPLLDDWLALAADSGRRLPGLLLADLLLAVNAVGQAHDAGRAAMVRAAGGPLAGWLVARNPDWQWLTEPAAFDLDGLEERWGDLPDETRVPAFAALRGAEPARAAALLAAVLGAEPAATAGALVGALADGLAVADVDVLEKALRDKRNSVRAAAGELLGRLPDSPRGQRLAAVALPSVSVQRRLRRRLDVTLLELPDLGPEGVRAAGTDAQKFRDLVAAVPLSAWPAGLELEPSELAGLAVSAMGDSDVVRADRAGALVDGWTRAAAAQRDRGWAVALAGAGAPVTPALTAALPPDAADALLEQAFRGVTLAGWPRLLEAAEGHLGSSSAAASVDALARLIRTTALPERPDIKLNRLVLGVTATLLSLGRSLPAGTSTAPLLAALERAPSPDAWRTALAGSGGNPGLIGMLSFRTALHAAFEGNPS